MVLVFQQSFYRRCFKSKNKFDCSFSWHKSPLLSLQLLQASPELMELGLTSSDWWPLNHHFTGDPLVADSTGSLYTSTVSLHRSRKRQPTNICRKLLSHSLKGNDWCNLGHSWQWFARLSSGLLQSVRKPRLVPSVFKKKWSWLIFSLPRWWGSKGWRHLSAHAGHFLWDFLFFLSFYSDILFN